MDIKTNFINQQFFPIQPELFKQDSLNKDNHLSSLTLNGKSRKTMLGQVFTPLDLAKFMVSLFKHKLNAKHRILDPCIGPNSFLLHFDELKNPPKIVGIELDESLITANIKSFYSKPERELIIDNFFNLPLSEKFDFIIENPPYVRQELMMSGENSKLIALQSLSDFSKIIPSKSNLYVYFILKSIFHLNNEGRMIAVIYDSWLYSDFGNVLKEIFIHFGSIEGIYHFKKNVFPDAEVGATVIDFKRCQNPKFKSKTVKLYNFKSLDEINSDSLSNKLSANRISVQDFLSFRFNEETILDFKHDLFMPIEKISSQPIQRGISSIANKYFIHQQKTFEESIPFIKDVTSIRSFNITNELFYLLFISKQTSTKTGKYLDFVKEEILSNSDKFKALKHRILNNQNWYKIQLKKPGNILFNYYLRKNIDFLLNEELHYSSDNFYILNIEKNLLANFAILNSSFTKIAVLLQSRNQGNGLRKVQLYEFKKIFIIDVNKLSAKSIQHLEILGKKLKSVDRFSEIKGKIISEIDEILLKEYNLRSKIQITTEQLNSDIQNIFSIN